MSNVDYEHLETQSAAYNQRLKVLESQLAATGDIHVRPDIITQIENIRRDIAKLEAQLNPSNKTRVHLITHPDTDPLPDHYVLDWSEYYHPVPTTEVWQSDIIPRLTEFRRTCSQESVILLRANAHFSAGVAFGYALHNRRNFKVWVDQKLQGQTFQTWRSDNIVRDSPLINVHHKVLGRGSGDILIELNISRTTTTEVNEWIENEGLNSSIQRRIVIQPKDGTSQTAIRDSIHATDLARAIGQEIVLTRDTYPHATIHVFASYPVGLAVLVGMHLNACKQIKWYDRDKDDDKYYEGWFLMREI